jgi:hypothetical protein
MAVLIAVGPAEGIMFSVKKNVGRIHVIRKKYLLAVPCGFVTAYRWIFMRLKE